MKVKIVVTTTLEYVTEVEMDDQDQLQAAKEDAMTAALLGGEQQVLKQVAEVEEMTEEGWQLRLPF